MYVFLFTDIEGSTRLWEQHTAAMTGVIARHDEILRDTVAAHGGRITKHTGDGITAVFQAAGQPLACALAAQVRFGAEPWGEIGALPIRVGLHAGEAEWIAGPIPRGALPRSVSVEAPGAAQQHTGDYFGPPVNATARVMSAAWGGQILVTPAATQASSLPHQAILVDLGQHLLKNVSAPQQLYQLDHPHLARHEFPPPRTLSGQSIRQAVGERGGQLAGMEPARMALQLLSATLLPALQGELDPESGALAGNLGVLEDLGAVSLRGFVAAFAARLRTGEPLPTSELQVRLQTELQARWQAGDESALALRADASRLLQAVHGVEAAMAAATGEVKEALARGLAGLGEQFGEFRWMLAGVQDTLAEMWALQREQLDLQREQLAKTEELLGRERPVLAWEPGDADQPPVFVREGAQDVAEAPVFVARQRELARLDGFLARALAGQGRVVFVAGGPGRGKTALLSEFARRAMETHPELLAASGTCNAFSGSGDPYLPFREALAMLSGEVEDRWLAGTVSTVHARRLWAALPVMAQALLRRGRNVLGVLVDGPRLMARATRATNGTDAPWLEPLRQVVSRGSGSTGLEQSHLFEQATNVLRLVSETHPLLLILDDLQWADAASIDLLHHLGRRLAGSRILLAGTYRPEEVAADRGDERPPRMTGRHPLAKVVHELTRQFGEVPVDLAEEAEEEGRGFVDALLESEPNRLGEGFRQALFQHTGGHPLFTVELLRAMQERGDLVREEDGCWVEGPALDWEALPARVEAVIEERIGRLSDDLRALLEVASVEGEEFTAQVVARVQDQRERQLLRSLSQELAKRHRLVRERGEERVGERLLSRYRFSHALFQHYLYNDLSAGERRLLHGEVAAVLEELFSGRTDQVAVQLAFHYGRAGAPSRALPYLIQAGHQARARYANQEAIGHYGEALQIMGKGETERFDLLDARASVYTLLARRAEQKADVDEMLALSEEEGDEGRRCDALLALADYHLSTDLAEARAPAGEALQIAEALADPVRQAWALQRLGELAHFLSDYRRSRTQLEAATELFLEAGMTAEAARCLHILSLTLGSSGEATLALEAVQRSVALSRQAGDRRQEATALRRLAIVLQNQNRHAEALPLAEQALALHREVGDRSEECHAMNVLGILSAYLRQFERAERYLRGSLQIAESLADPIGIQYASLNLSLFHYVRPGELQACLAFLDEQASKAQAWADERLPAMLLLLKTRALMALGQYLPALSGAERALAILHTKGLARTDEAYARLRLGHAQSWLGRYDEARRNLQSAAAVARESRDESLLGHALMWEAEAALNEGEPETMAAALGLVDEALSAFREGFEDAERALAYAVGARLHLALGELGEARAWSRRAVDSMADHPAPIEPEQVYFTHHRALRALGREAEADEYLQRAYERVMLVADKTPDPELRRSWLENVEANRQIVEAWAARGGP